MTHRKTLSWKEQVSVSLYYILDDYNFVFLIVGKSYCTCFSTHCFTSQHKEELHWHTSMKVQNIQNNWVQFFLLPQIFQLHKIHNRFLMHEWLLVLFSPLFPLSKICVFLFLNNLQEELRRSSLAPPLSIFCLSIICLELQTFLWKQHWTKVWCSICYSLWQNSIF